MADHGRGARFARTTAACLLALCFVGAVGLTLRPIAATAEDVGVSDDLKAYWQSSYRKLRLEEARLVETVKLATKEYADSNRRTYRRSGVRHFHRANANEAERQLKEVRDRIEAMRTDVLVAGGSVHWLDEIDEEPIDPSGVSALGVYADDGRFGGKGAYEPERGESEDADVPAIEGGTEGGDVEESEDEAVDDGRNPMYSDDEDVEDEEPASIGEGGFSPYDYEYWRTDRERYEGERAPDREQGEDD